MKIYTKTGDSGETALFGGSRVGKDDPRIEATGALDELNAALAIVRSEGAGDLDDAIRAVQDQLFTLGSNLAAVPGTKASKAVPPFDPSWVTSMEAAIDRFDEELAPLSSFILPGGTKAAAHLHFARTVCRRAERRVVPLIRAGLAEPFIGVYVNRLSDFLFTLARVANRRAMVGDVPWLPAK
jgi:cob(I)alamin adenosyltransferase